jgi:hypothetical protein
VSDQGQRRFLTAFPYPKLQKAMDRSMLYIMVIHHIRELAESLT